MKISELSERSGVPVATIKYYIRERLLPAGELLKQNQSEYAEAHVQRLTLVRALLEVGQVPIAAARSVLNVVDSEAPIFQAMGEAQKAVSPVIAEEAVDATSLAFIDDSLRGWNIEDRNPGRLAAAQVHHAFTASSTPPTTEWFAAYARAARDVAQADLAEIERRESRVDKAEMVVLGTVLGDALFAAFRRAAGESIAEEMYAGPEDC